MVLTVSTGLCVRPRLWQRQRALMLTRRAPISVEKWRGENDVVSPEGGTKENAQTYVTQARPWVLSNPSITQVS